VTEVGSSVPHGGYSSRTDHRPVPVAESSRVLENLHAPCPRPSWTSGTRFSPSTPVVPRSTPRPRARTV
jgi:hypothetical protein